MKEGWEVKKLGEIALVIAGQSPEGKHYNNKAEGLAFYQGKKEFTKKYLGEPTTWTTQITKIAEPLDILMSVRAPVGTINIAIDRICIGRGLAAIRPLKGTNNHFLFYFLFSKQDEITGKEGAVFPSINKKEIENIIVPIPSLSEQQRIVEILDNVFSKLDTVRQNAERNRDNAKELFQNYLDNIFSRNEYFEIKKLGNTLIKTEAINPLKKPDVFFQYIDVSSVSNKTFSINETSTIMGKNAPSRAKKLIKEGDVIFATVRPTLKRIAIIPKEFNNEVCSTGYCVLRPSDIILTDWIFYFLQTTDFLTAMERSQRGASYPAVTDGDIKEQNILCPSISEQQQIVSKLDALSVKCKELENNYLQTIKDCDELKKAILAKAFNGEL